MADARYAIDYAKRNAKCQKCKQPIEKGSVRIAKLVPNIFSDNGGDMKQYHHPVCLFEAFKRVKATTKVIEDPGDLEGWDDINDEDRKPILQLIRAHEEFSANKKSPTKGKGKGTPAKSPAKPIVTSPVAKPPPPKAKLPEYKGDKSHKDNSFREFRRLVANISETSSYLSKTEIVRIFFNKGSEKTKFQGDLHVWVRLLLPGVVKRIYNLQSKQLVKIFSRIFNAKESDMLTDLEQGDVAETVAKFFEESDNVEPSKKANLTLHQVDAFLDSLTELTKEDDQFQALHSIAKKCTVNDLKMVVRLIKGDLRMQAGAKHILEALHKDAHEAFNSSRQIEKVISRIIELRESGTPNGPLDVGAALMSPVQPMLAMACKSVDMAFDKCPNGMFSEIKYDGERVQLHKDGAEFKYFSRSLKPVLPHKVAHFKEHIPKAFPNASELILDAEVLMVDNNTGDPLPFGSLGVHKAAGFKDATPCLFVFDCMFYNGQNLMNKPIRDRRKMLQEVMVEVGNNVKFSEAQLVTKKSQLCEMIQSALNKGLEGLVLKDLKSTYEPGKRHWLKVKKDYLNEGAMADSADLVVLGAWYGSGKRGSIMSIFLMGCFDKTKSIWKTVTKVHTGHDDETLDRLQKELGPKMMKIKGNFDKVPVWLDCTRQMVPDFVAKDPKESPVWEITGAEFSKAEIHTAGGISIRFPRVTKIRDDKTWETATSLSELKVLFEESKRSMNIEISEEEMKKDKTPVKRPASTSSSKSPSPIKKIKVDKSDLEISLGPSGKSYDKVSILSKSSGFELKIVRGDLFKEPDNHVSLAHCVSRDLKMSKGIAKLFRSKFGRVQDLEKAKADIGEVAVLDIGPNRFTYNMVTKAKYSDFPTYESLRRSLTATKEHALQNNVKHVAMPKIGCGLDKLNWNAVRTLIKNVFLETDIKITVYHLDSDVAPVINTQAKTPQIEKKKNVIGRSFPMLDIAEGNLTPIVEQDAASTATTPEKVLKLDGLPDVFSGDKIFLQNGIKNAELLKRYIISYGGEVIDEDHFSEANLVVRASNVDQRKPLINKFGILSKKKAPEVSEEWLLESIQSQTRKSL